MLFVLHINSYLSKRLNLKHLTLLCTFDILYHTHRSYITPIFIFGTYKYTIPEIKVDDLILPNQ